VAKYLVTMEIARVNPLLLLDQLARVLRESILLSVETLINLKAQGKVTTGATHRAALRVVRSGS
jgi:hypothetical protein